MKLRPGDRLPDVNAQSSLFGDDLEGTKNRAVYRVTQVVAETAWHGIYEGKKVFRNFRFDTQNLEEAKDEECLDVFLKTIIYTRLDDREYVKTRRDHFWFEAKKVLGATDTNLFPEPLDFLEIANHQDAFSFRASGRLLSNEPVLVFEKIHGQNLAKWRSSVRPSTQRVLSVAAEVLELMATTHPKQLLPGAINPGALWIDEMDRVHCVATDTIVGAAQAQKWRRSCTADRFPQGFSAPESFDAAATMDERTDIYSWAALAYFLVTGESPAQVAAAEGHRYATFGTLHFDRLRRELEKVPPAIVPRLCHLFSIQGARFIRNWPDSFINVLRCCLEHKATLRPSSVEMMRSWWTLAPPSPPAAAVCIRTREKADVLVTTRGLAKNINVVVRRRQDSLPTGPRDGDQVGESQIGGDAVAIPLATSRLAQRSPSQSEARFGVFSRVQEDGKEVYSAVIEAQLIDLANEGSLALYLDRIAALEHEPQDLFPTPRLRPEIELFVAWDGFPAFAESALKSQSPLLRRWVIEILGRNPTRLGASDAAVDVLWRGGLLDARFDLRLAAAAAILGRTSTQRVDLIVNLAKALGGVEHDNWIRAARNLQLCGVPPELLAQAIKQLDADRAVKCQVCHREFKAAVIEQHLIASHDFVVVQESLLPYNSALKRLWQHIFNSFDLSAACQLAQLFRDRHASDAAAAFASAFHAQFEEKWFPLATQWDTKTLAKNRLGLGRCLSAHAVSRKACERLLVYDSAELRELARLVLIPIVAPHLRDATADLTQFRHRIDFLCQKESIDVKIATCRTLVDCGASESLGSDCQRELELDRTFRCERCRVLVSRRENERHLRTVHEIYEFRGRTYSWEELLTLLVDLLFGSEPDFEAARMLMEVVAERSEPNRAAQECASLLAINVEFGAKDCSTKGFIASAAHAIGLLPEAEQISYSLLSTEGSLVRDLGLEIFTFLKSQPSRQFAECIIQSLGEPCSSPSTRMRVVASFLRVYNSDSSLCARALRRWVSCAADKLDGIALLESLENTVGALEAIDIVSRELDESAKMRCPRCGVVFSGPQMRQHVLDTHGMVLTGRTMRQPWTVAEECLEEYVTTRDSSLLTRAETLAKFADPEFGIERLARFALNRQIHEPRYRELLESRALERQCAVCPTCFEFVPSPDRPPVDEVSITEAGDLVSKAIAIRTKSNFWTTIEIEGRGVAWTGGQPDVCISKRGAMILAALITGVPLVMFLLAYLLGGLSSPGLVVFLAIMAPLAVASTAIFYNPPLLTALDTAWEIVVPLWVSEGPNAVVAAFLAGLTRASKDRGEIGRRKGVLKQAIHKYHGWVQAGHLAYPYIGYLYLLALRDQLQRPGGARAAVRVLEPLLSRCLAGKLPLSCIDVACSDGTFVSSLTLDALLLVRHIICKTCRGLGYTVGDVEVLCSRSKTIRCCFDAKPSMPLDVTAHWFAMMQLFPNGAQSLDGNTVLTFAENGLPSALEQWPDLLAVSKDATITACVRGIVFGGKLFTSPSTISLREDKRFVQTGWTHQRVDGGPDLRYKDSPPVGHWQVTSYQLRVGDHVFAYSQHPAGIIASLQRWMEVLFEAIKPTARELASQAPSGLLPDQSVPSSTMCPKCRGRNVRLNGARRC